MYRVLLADDELVFLEFLKEAINWNDFDCEICAVKEDGLSAYDYILKERPDIAFIDINMPKKTGLEICEMIRNRDIPIKLVIITGHDEFSFAYKSIKLGIDDYLLKPFSRDELKVTLQKVIRSLKQECGMQPVSLGEELEHIRESATKYEIISKEIDKYLLDHYSDSRLSLNRIAEEFGFESSYMRKFYKWKTGLTIMQKLEEIRIEKAKALLRSGQYRNRDVAAFVGFSDQYYFSKRFKQICGKTPTEFKENITGR